MEKLQRIFKLGNLRLNDMQPELPALEAVKLYATTYPLLNACQIESETIEDGNLVITLSKPVVKTKG